MFKEHFGEAAQNHTTCDVQELGGEHLWSNVQSSFEHNKQVSRDGSLLLDNQLHFTPFRPEDNLPKISLFDPLITAIQNIIVKELGFIKVIDEELMIIIENVNGREIPD